jgi:hypothetical protein
MAFIQKGINWDGNTKFIKVKDGPRKIDSKIGIADNDYMVKYYGLLKEASSWSSQGQVKLAREAERRAHCLLTGNLGGYQKQVHSEHLFTPTRKFKHIIDYHNGN